MDSKSPYVGHLKDSKTVMKPIASKPTQNLKVTEIKANPVRSTTT